MQNAIFLKIKSFPLWMKLKMNPFFTSLIWIRLKRLLAPCQLSQRSLNWKINMFPFFICIHVNTVSSDLLELFIFSLGLTEYEFEQKDQEFSRFSIFCSWFSRSLIVICVICKSFLIYVISNPSSKIFRPCRFVTFSDSGCCPISRIPLHHSCHFHNAFWYHW